MIKHTIRRIFAMLAAAAVMTAAAGCGNNSSEKQSGGESSSESSQAETKAPVKVTLPPKTTASEEQAEPEEPLYGADIPYTPAMWKATAPDGREMYMMGSMHALNDTCYPLPEEVTAAYESSDILAVECDIAALTASAAQLKFAGLINYPKGETIEDHLSAETWEKVSGYLKLHDSDIEDAETKRAWAIYSSVQALSLENTTLSSDKGFDRYLLKQARGDGKEIYEVESVGEQFEMLAGISDTVYDLLLADYSPENAAQLEETNKELFKAWKTGDLEWIAKESEGEYEDVPDDLMAEINNFKDAMYNNRNEHMAKDAKELMSRDKKTFFVVGLAHFIGDKGIISLLEKEGYTFERIEIKAG
ncbi:MAG: TraB/GumN family protein [Ruminococcus sp.]|nr:TraB/GumN family protein [Ruminococcus sp.]